MARYIDADKAEKEFEETFCKHCNSYDGAKCRACDMKDGADIFNDALTEDVQTVKHGKWRFSGELFPNKKLDLFRVQWNGYNASILLGKLLQLLS